MSENGNFKLRDLLRFGNQAGVPDNLRAADMPKRAAEERQLDEHDEALLAHIKKYHGELIPKAELARAADLGADTTTVGERIKDLIKAGRIYREEVQGVGVRYFYIEQPEETTDVAVDEEDEQPKEKPRESRDIGEAGRRKAALTYVREHSGEILRPSQLNHVTRFSHKSGNQKLFNTLVEEGRIRREKVGPRTYRYHYIDVDTGKPILAKGDERNGEVTVASASPYVPGSSLAEKLWNYIINHPGEAINVGKVGQSLGYTEATGPNAMVRSWLRKGLLRTKKAGQLRKFYLVTQPETTALAPEQVWEQTTTEPHQEPERVFDETPRLDEAPAVADFLARLDSTLWAYLQRRSSESGAYVSELGVELRALSAYRAYCAEQEKGGRS